MQKFLKKVRFISAVAGVMSESNRGSESKSEREGESFGRFGLFAIVGRLLMEVCSNIRVEAMKSSDTLG